MRHPIWVLLLGLFAMLGCTTHGPPVGSGEPTGVAKSALTVIGPGPTGSNVGPFGVPTFSSFGQIITVPATDTVLQSFSVVISVPTTLIFRGEVYAWDGTKATGPNLYESSPRSTTSTANATVVFDVGGLSLTAGNKYVLIVSSSRDAGTGSGSMGFSSANPYAGGNFVYLNSGTNPATWTTTAWNAIGTYDLAFTATFGLPTATTTTLVSSVNPSVFGQSITLTATTTGASSAPTGTITFQEGATILGTASLNGAGQASLAIATLAVGTHAITADYGGDVANLGSSSVALSQMVSQAATISAIVSSSNPSIVGGNVTFTATIAAIAPGTGIPTGTVTFMAGATTLGTGTLDVTGATTFPTTTLTVGSHNVVAVYTGDPSFASSTSSAVVQVVQQDGVTVTLASTPNPSVHGASVTFTATVASAGAGGIPTGTVTFSEGGSVLATAPVNGSGIATFTTATLAGGSHSISAAYSGDANHGVASGSDTHVVDTGPSTTTSASLTNPSVYGQSVTFTVTVTGALVTPSGTVSFAIDGALAGNSPLDGAGAANFSTAALAVGSHAVVATYGGDVNFSGSAAGAITQQVGKAATRITLGSSSTPSIVGASVTFTALVASVAPGAGVPTGTVTFRDGATTLGTGTLDGLGIAIFSTSALAVGGHSITADYGGDTSFVPITSSDLTQAVKVDGDTEIVASSQNPSIFAATVTFTATLSSVGTGGIPSGTVTFKDGATVLGSGTLNGAGVASVATASLTGGTHSITAVYGGDVNHAAGSSAALTQTVVVAVTTTTLTSATNPSVFGQSVTITATVVSPAAGTLTGTVTFKDGASTLGTGTLGAGGTATFTTTLLGVATHAISAAYGGDTNHGPSTATALSQVVSKATSTTAVASSSNPSLIATSVTFTATVTAGAPGSGTPSGTVTFKDGTTVLGAATLSGSGVATLPTPALGAGAHTITAEYAGDGTFTASVSTALDQAVNTAVATMVLSTAPSPSTFGASVIVTATLTGVMGTATGTIAFKEGTTALGTATLGAAGVATLSIATLSAGTHTLSADYSGDSTYAIATGTVSHVVNKAATSSTLVATKNPSVVSESVTFTLTVASLVPGFTGQVEFFDGAMSLGSAPLIGASATLTTATLTQNGHSITATYMGDASFATSSSDALTQNVGPAAVDGGAAVDGASEVDGGAPTAEAGVSKPDAGVVAEAGVRNDAGLSSEGGSVTNLQDSGGCGCRIDAQAPSAGGGLFLLAGIAVLLGRRRRTA